MQCSDKSIDYRNDTSSKLYRDVINYMRYLFTNRGNKLLCREHSKYIHDFYYGDVYRFIIIEYFPNDIIKLSYYIRDTTISKVTNKLLVEVVILNNGKEFKRQVDMIFQNHLLNVPEELVPYIVGH